MHHGYNHVKSVIAKALSVVFAISAVFCFTGDSRAAQCYAEPIITNDVKVIHEFPSNTVFIIPAICIGRAAVTLSPIQQIETALFTSEQTLLTSSVQTECTEAVEPTEEPIPERENTLYCFVEDGIRTDVPIEYQDYIYNLLKDYEMTDKYELILTMIYHESGYDASQISPTNDYGLMQINKCNHKWLRETLGITDFLDPYQSIQAGVYMISNYLKKYSAEQALVCYNMGEQNALKKGISSSVYSRETLADMDLLVKLES